MQYNGKKLDEEHITIINEPGSEYMWHAVSLGHKTEDIYNVIVNSTSEHFPAYLRDIILAISIGILTDSSANRSPDKIGYARWLTTGNRILRVDISQNHFFRRKRWAYLTLLEKMGRF